MPMTGKSQDRKPAEAFLNLYIRKKDGTLKAIKATIPLDSEKGGWQERAIAKSKVDEEFELSNLVGKIHVVGATEDVDDYDF